MGGGKGTSTSKSAPPKEIMEAYRKSIGYAGQAISKPYEQYQGQLVAGLNPTQQQGIANVNAAQGVALPFIQQGAQYTNQAAQGVNPQMINQFMSPYLNTVVGATQRNLLESNAQQQNALKSQAIQSGAFGGDRARIGQAELARQQGLAGGQVIGGLMNQGFGQAVAGAQQNVQNMLAGGQQLGAMGQAAQQSILQGAQAQLAAGAQQQATDQAFLQSAYDQFLQRQAFPFQQAQFYANIAQGIGAGAGGTTSQTPAAPNPFSQALGALTAIGTISDERAKENIEPIGQTNDGQTIYRYNYKGSPKTEIGLIAQEVEKTHPEAVGSLGGIKMVDLEAATENAAQRNGKALGGSSMGGLVTPGMERQAFAQGGFGMVPYADFFKGLSFVPGGELTYRGQSPGSTLPTGYKMEELQKMAEGSSFDELNAMSAEDVANLKKGFGKIGTGLGLMPSSSGAEGARAPSFSGPLSNFGPGVTSFFSSIRGALPFAEGGVVPRHGYQTDGAVRDESPLPPFLVKAESGGDFAADNEMGYVGRGQFGEARLTDAKRAGVLPPDVTLDQFKADPGLQKAVESWHVQDVNNYIQDRGLGAFVGKEINGVPVTPQGLLAVAHLGGKGGMEKFVKSGGRYNPKDANGTSLMDYLALAAGTEGGTMPASNEGVVIPASQDTAVLEPASSGVVPADLPDMPPAGVVPGVDGTVQANYSATGVVAPTADEAPATGEAPARSRSIIERLINQDLSDQARTGLLAAGLSMMGGTSPYFGVNVGKGGLAGLQAYYKGLENQRDLAVKGAEIERTLAEARSTGATAGTTEQTNRNLLQQEYVAQAAIAKNAGKPYPTWAEFLEMRGYGDMGWDAFDPSIVLETVPSPETTQGAPTSGEPSEPGSEPEATAPPPNEPFAETNVPSAVIKPTDINENIPNTLPSQNPYLLTLDGSPAAMQQLDKLRELGYVTTIDGKRVSILSKKEVENRQNLNTGLNTDFSKLQNEIPNINSVLNEISKVLQGFETTKLTDLQGKVSGILYNVTGTRESLENATAADLLDKLFKQLSLVSQIGGEAGAAGIEKIRQIEGASGTSTMSAPALRDIIGKAKALNEWNEARVKDWGKFIDKYKATGISDSMRNEWLKSWGDKLDAYYVPKNIANTPVKDNSLWKKIVKDGKEQYDANNFKEGWQYVMPNGKIARFTRGEDGKAKFTAVEQ